MEQEQGEDSKADEQIKTDYWMEGVMRGNLKYISMKQIETRLLVDRDNKSL